MNTSWFRGVTRHVFAECTVCLKESALTDSRSTRSTGILGTIQTSQSSRGSLSNTHLHNKEKQGRILSLTGEELNTHVLRELCLPLQHQFVSTKHFSRYCKKKVAQSFSELQEEMKTSREMHRQEIILLRARMNGDGVLLFSEVHKESLNHRDV